MSRAIVLVDHGSRVPAANRVLEEVAAALGRVLGPDVHVAHAHQEAAPPTIAEALDAVVRAGATDITVVPFFLAPGRHAAADVPRLAAAALAGKDGIVLRVTGPLGDDVPGLAELTLRLVERAEGQPASTARTEAPQAEGARGPVDRAERRDESR